MWMRLFFALSLGACSGHAMAEAVPPASTTDERLVDATAEARFAACDVREVITRTGYEKVHVQASASCDTGGGGEKSCSVQVSAAANHVLDRNDLANACYKLPDGGDNPCAFVRYGPVVFGSPSSASQVFSTNSGRVAVQLIVGQFVIRQTIESDTVIQHLQLVAGGKFIVKRTKASESTVSLECTKPNGEQFINLIPGKDNTGRIRQISMEQGNAFDLYTFEVTR